MIGRKLVLTNIKKNEFTEKFVFEPFDLDELKHISIKKLKRYGFIVLVITLRISIKSSHSFKNLYKKIKNKTITTIDKNLFNKNKKHEEKEVSNFLKMVSDYKHRIRQIKHKIKEEEGIK
jgi:peroxiredoxin